jgi:NAD(P)-dependent dehydrogenase (short-subunit alcohol dehydrogenase family)
VKKFIETFVKATPLRRAGEPLDIAKGIVFLSSIDAQFITGANLVIDGGVMFNIPIDLFSTLSI